MPNGRGKIRKQLMPDAPNEADQIEAPANRTEERLRQLEKAVQLQENEFIKLRRHAPSVAVQRERRIRLTYEIAGLAITAAGAWWVYPPAGLLTVGVWLLADVITSRRQKKGKS